MINAGLVPGATGNYVVAVEGLGGATNTGRTSAIRLSVVLSTRFRAAGPDNLNLMDRQRIEGTNKCYSVTGCNRFYPLQAAGPPTWTKPAGFAFDFNYTLSHSIDNSSVAESGAAAWKTSRRWSDILYADMRKAWPNRSRRSVRMPWRHLCVIRGPETSGNCRFYRTGGDRNPRGCFATAGIPNTNGDTHRACFARGRRA